MCRRYLDLIFLNILVMLGAVLALTDSHLLWVRAPVGILMTLVVPGYILTEVLFPRATVSGFERLALIAGLSVSAAAVGGLLLWMGFGSLDTEIWIFAIWVFTILGSGTIYFQRRHIRKEEVQTENVEGNRVHSSGGTRSLPLIVRWLPFFLAAVIVVGSVLYVQAVAKAQPDTQITQMWMIPDQKDPAHTIQLGVITHTDNPHSYIILLNRGGHPISEWTDVQMQPNDHWQTTVKLPAPLPGSGPLKASLIDTQSPSLLLRQVTMWPERK
jgi:hypothetical protein